MPLFCGLVLPSARKVAAQHSSAPQNWLFLTKYTKMRQKLARANVEHCRRIGRTCFRQPRSNRSIRSTNYSDSPTTRGHSENDWLRRD